MILDIFAQHARTKEGQLQVELALLTYRLPRLTNMWSHLERQSAGAKGILASILIDIYLSISTYSCIQARVMVVSGYVDQEKSSLSLIDKI